MTRQSELLKMQLRQILLASESDKVSGASAISLMLELWNKEKSPRHAEFETAFVKILHDSVGDELKTLSWLLSGMAANGIILRSAISMLRGKLIEMRVSNQERSVIQQVEKDIDIISGFERSELNTQR